MVNRSTTTGHLAGGPSNDVLTGIAQDGTSQIHIYGKAGDDLLNMSFAHITRFSHGHHARGDGSGGIDDTSTDRGSDIFNFIDLDLVDNIIVGRIEDFDASRDTIAINGEAITLSQMEAGAGTTAGYQWRIVEYDSDSRDSITIPQQWMLIDTPNGHVFYALEGARVTNGDGAANGGNQEAHFVGTGGGHQVTAAELAGLQTVGYVDPHNYIPAGYQPNGGVAINDDDNTFADAQAQIRGTALGDLIAAGLNDDDVFSGNGDDYVWGGSGDDRINGGGGNDTLWGGPGNDKVYGSVGNDSISGETGDDLLYGGNGADRIQGGAGADRLYGQAGDDDLQGDDGNDLLNGGGGNDTLRGGAGADRLFSGPGADTLYGEDGNDILRGAAGDDNLNGGLGNDRLLGQTGNDQLDGGAGKDFMSGGAGNDVLLGGEGNDRMYGGAGDDQLDGGAGHDVIRASTGNDTLQGGAGNDRLFGQDGNDQLDGGTGRDVLRGGAGKDTMTGGAGGDTFQFGAGDMVDWDTLTGTHLQRYHQIDVITDFEIGVDKIEFLHGSGVTGLADLQAWQKDIDGNSYFVLQDQMTHERLLVGVDSTVTWNDFFDATNFTFDDFVA